MEVYSENSECLHSLVCTPSAFTRTNLIHLQKIGEHHLMPSETSKSPGNLSYLFFQVTDGSGRLICNDDQYDLQPGVCVFLDCREEYTCGTSDEEEMTIEFLYFYGPNMIGIYDKYLEEGGLPCFTVEDFGAYTRIMEEIQGILSGRSNRKDMQIYEKLISLLTLIMKDGEGAVKRLCKVSQKQDMQEVKDYLDQNYHEKITLDDLSDRFFINKFYLTRLFKEQFGISINSYLIKVRISYARRMLRFTDMPIEKISQACGIGDANYFARLFKKNEGMSPGEFRRIWND